MKLSVLIALAATLAAAQSQENPVSFKITHVESSKPQIVRIFNLDEGFREIALPPARLLSSESSQPADAPRSEKPQIAIIFNLSEGTREIVLSPAP